MEKSVIAYLNATFETTTSDNVSAEEFADVIGKRVNDLIVYDFERLIQILYRIDISEQKLKLLLKENDKSDTGKIIALLIIERQNQKAKSRQQFNRDINIIDENDAW